MTKSMRNLFAAAAASAALSCAMPMAQAATVTCPTAGTCVGNISVTLGTPLPNETDIFLTAANGTSFIGNVGANNGPSLVTFTSTQTISAANGFATFTPISNNSVFNELTLTVASGFTFNDITFGTLGNTDLELIAKNGSTTVGTYSIGNLGSGLNQFLADATNGSVFTSIMLESQTGFSQIKQVQISGLSAVPIPATLPLLGSALGAGYLAVRRRRKRNLKPAEQH
jgi:hypothetical protein